MDVAAKDAGAIGLGRGQGGEVEAEGLGGGLD
jgi:hypothetical protein